MLTSMERAHPVFVGTHIVGVDGKGRCSIPAPFRAALQGADTVYVWPSYKASCLEGGDLALLRRYQGAMANLEEARDDFEYAIFGEARPLEFDQTGRVSLPEILRRHAGLEAQAAFAGLSDRFEIWNPAALEARVLAARERAMQARTLLRRQDPQVPQ